MSRASRRIRRAAPAPAARRRQRRRQRTRPRRTRSGVRPRQASGSVRRTTRVTTRTSSRSCRPSSSARPIRSSCREGAPTSTSSASSQSSSAGRRSTLPTARAADYIFGYTAHHDVSDRGGRGDRKMGGSDWLIGKNHDTFGPLGPFIVPKEFLKRSDEYPPHDVAERDGDAGFEHQSDEPQHLRAAVVCVEHRHAQSRRRHRRRQPGRARTSSAPIRVGCGRATRRSARSKASAR